MTEPIMLKIEMFEENGQIVSVCPDLNVSSFGNTKEEAEKSLIEAVALFLEECHKMGTLETVLEEAGFRFITAPKQMCMNREPIVIERLELKGALASA